MSGLPLETERLRLRDFVAGDFDAVHAYASDPEVVRHMDWGPNDASETREFLRRVTAQQGEDPRQSWELAIVLRESGELVGGCGLMPRRLPFREWELGFVLRRDQWRCGIMSEAARAVVAFGFGEVGAHRIFARVDPENVGSIRVLERLGMRHEGTRVRDELVRGAWRDTHIYARLEDE